MSQLKLTADSGGGTVAIKAPASTTGNAALELTVPGTGSATVDTLGRAGNILQVVQTVKTDVFTSNSTNYTDVTGLNLAITPSSTSSKILINVSFNHQSNTQDRWRAFQIARGSTAIYRGNADGSRTQASVHSGLVTGSGDAVTQQNSFIQFLDSPSTTSAVTYYLQGKVQSGAYFVINRSRVDDNADYIGRTASSITLMEVAA
tara:strand:- start:615 stop:1226 length:612 start_codon:yes stop_codon:yes gene_type:complete